MTTALGIASLVNGDYWLTATSVVAGTCYVGYKSITKQLNNSKYTSKFLFPVNGVWTTGNKWMANNLAFASQHGFYYSSKAEYDAGDADEEQPFGGAQPLVEFSAATYYPVAIGSSSNTNMATIWQSDPEYFHEMLDLANQNPTGLWENGYLTWHNANELMKHVLAVFQAAYLYLNRAGDALQGTGNLYEGYITTMGLSYIASTPIQIEVVNDVVFKTDQQKADIIVDQIASGTLVPLSNVTNSTLSEYNVTNP
jgi:hypothetical protein